MLFQLAVAGILPEDSQIHNEIRQLIERMNGHLSQKDGAMCIQALISPSYTDLSWKSLIGQETPVLGFCKNGDPEWSDVCEKRVWEDTSLRGIVGEVMCNRADLVLVVWNEDVTEFSGASWELIQLAHEKKTPCLWISSRTGMIYWSKDSYYERYNPAVLDRLCDDHQGVVLQPIPDTEKHVPLLSLGIVLRRRFLNKYRALQSEAQPVEDCLLHQNFSLEGEGVGAEGVRRKIKDQFHQFDQAAIALTAQYQAIIYWRAILPFVASIFLAIGFYAESLLSVTKISSAVLAVLAGTGFLIHGLLNLYVFFLSRNSAVKDKHQAFLQNRYIAEILRVLVHFVPYGIYIDLRQMCGGNEETRAAIQNMTLGDEPDIRRVDGNSVMLVLTHVKEMIQDQIAYHNAAAGRYRRILNHLDKWHHVIFSIGFVMVILRALLQFYVSFFPLGSFNGVNLNSYIRSFANMVALLLPAWASYFSSKTTLCNFRYNYDNHTRMAERLAKTLAQMEELETKKDSIPLDILNALSEEISQIMIVEDTLAWERKYQSSAVTVL